jgi:hypothetical protein
MLYIREHKLNFKSPLKELNNYKLTYKMNNITGSDVDTLLCSKLSQSDAKVHHLNINIYPPSPQILQCFNFPDWKSQVVYYGMDMVFILQYTTSVRFFKIVLCSQKSIKSIHNSHHTWYTKAKLFFIKSWNHIWQVLSSNIVIFSMRY